MTRNPAPTNPVAPDLIRGPAAFLPSPRSGTPGRARGDDEWFGGRLPIPRTRHAELVSATISPHTASGGGARWALKQVQGDVGKGE